MKGMTDDAINARATTAIIIFQIHWFFLINSIPLENPPYGKCFYIHIFSIYYSFSNGIHKIMLTQF